eukprot:12929643-Prorocentrum_lima.AAC.1
MGAEEAEPTDLPALPKGGQEWEDIGSPITPPSEEEDALDGQGRPHQTTQPLLQLGPVKNVLA